MDNLESGVDDSGVFKGSNVEVIPKPEEAEPTELRGRRTLTKIMQLTLPKKMEPYKVPSTIKEILETGLLEGLHVAYYDRKNVSRLVGRIRGLGIMCSCLLCKGISMILL